MDQRYTDEVEHRYGEIRCPVCILWGEDDRWIPIVQGRALAARIPSAVFRSVQNAGHLVQEDAPEAVVATRLGVIGSDEKDATARAPAGGSSLRISLPDVLSANAGYVDTAGF